MLNRDIGNEAQSISTNLQAATIKSSASESSTKQIVSLIKGDNIPVYYKKQEGPTCWYAILQRLKPENNEKNPEIKEFCEQVTRLHSAGLIYSNLYNYKKVNSKSSSDLINYLDHFNDTERKKILSHPLNEDIKKECIDYFKELFGLFNEQHGALMNTHFYDVSTFDNFIERKIYQLAEKTLHQMLGNQRITDVIPEIKLDESSKGSWPENQIQLLAIKRYGLVFSSWQAGRDAENFNQLREEISQYGALYTGGLFGVSINSRSNKLVTNDRIAGRVVYQLKSFWGAVGHAILVIKADTESNSDEQYVYYVDPFDDNIYRLDFSNFVDNLSNFNLKNVISSQVSSNNFNDFIPGPFFARKAKKLNEDVTSTKNQTIEVKQNNGI